VKIFYGVKSISKWEIFYEKNPSWKIKWDCPFKSMSRIGTENKKKYIRTRCGHRMTTRIARTGQAEPDNLDKNRIARTGQPGKIARTR
jgi:hypothetical protein